MNIDRTDPTKISNYFTFPYAIKPTTRQETVAKVAAVALHIFLSIATVGIYAIVTIANYLKHNPAALGNSDSDYEDLASEDEEEYTDDLTTELARVQHLDVKLGSPKPGSWREYGERACERQQTFDAYIARMPPKQPLVIQRIGSFDSCDLKIFEITSEFLGVFHQVPVDVEADDLTMDQLKEKYFSHMQNKYDEYFESEKASIEEKFPRTNGQYEGDAALDMIWRALRPMINQAQGQSCNVIAFTSEDLYTSSMQNFVYGVADMYRKVGIWSNARLGNPKRSVKDFEKCLLRMMKISAHEFGHMRGIPHCTEYECNIGGYMSAVELDSRPLTYCLQDSAKICGNAGITLLKYHKRLLKYFQNFNQTHQLNCDLSKEINILKSRITALQKV